MGGKDKYTKKTIKQENDNQDIAVDWPVPIFRHPCPGYPMTSYMPQDPALREKYLQNSFTPLRIWEEDAMQSVLLEKKTSNHKFGGREWMDEYGRGTFDWPALHTLRQKPLQANTMTTTATVFFLGQMDTCLYRCSFTTQRGNGDRTLESVKDLIKSVEEKARSKE